MDKKLIYNGKIVSPFTAVENGFIVLSGKKIEFIGSEDADKEVLEHEMSGTGRKFDANGNTLVPGLIDIHTHGVLGKDYSSSPDLVFEDSPFRASKGVTAFLPTVGCFTSTEKAAASAEKLSEYVTRPMPGARPLGINMEGPFLHPELGAQDKINCLRQVDLDYLEQLLKSTKGTIKIMTISPELPGAMEGIRCLKSNGIIPAVGHTLAEDKVLDEAVRAGARLVTHLFNTTYQPEQDVKGVIKPGVNEYLLIRDDIMAEFICDSSGTHIHPVMLEVLLRCKTVANLIMISDSFLSPGLEENIPIHMPDGRTMVMRNGVNYQDPSGHITGSAMTLDRSVRSLMQFTSTDLSDALLMASCNPAKLLGIEASKGSLEPGKDGDIVMVDDDFTILKTFVEGDLVYEQ